MSQELQTILLSLITSLIVSLITFILGLKSGKNQTDRAKLQTLYKDLYSHFSDLENAVKCNNPKSYQHYKKVEKGMYSVEYYPPVKEMKRTGEILFIKKALAEEALELEKQFMNYSNDLNHLIPKLHEVLISNLDLYQPGYKFNCYRGDANDKSHFESANPSNCRSFRPKNYRDLIDRQAIIALFKELDIDRTTAVEFTSGDNPISYSAKLYPLGINLDVDTYLNLIFSEFEKIPEFNELYQRKEELVKKANKICDKLAKKAKEPTSFWETMFGAFGDMFH